MFGTVLFFFYEFLVRSFVLFSGTTCATVLAQAILTEGCKSVAAGVNVMDLRRGMNMSIDAVISHLKSRAWMISTPEEITQVRKLVEKKCHTIFMFFNSFTFHL